MLKLLGAWEVQSQTRGHDPQLEAGGSGYQGGRGSAEQRVHPPERLASCLRADRVAGAEQCAKKDQIGAIGQTHADGFVHTFYWPPDLGRVRPELLTLVLRHAQERPQGVVQL